MLGEQGQQLRPDQVQVIRHAPDSELIRPKFVDHRPLLSSHCDETNSE
jgi:hypothetical protein